MGEGDKMDKMINVKRTIAEFRRWPGVVDGYTNLALFSGFCMLYVYILLEQQDIPRSHKIDFMVRSALLDQDGALSKVNTEGISPPTTPHSPSHGTMSDSLHIRSSAPHTRTPESAGRAHPPIRIAPAPFLKPSPAPFAHPTELAARWRAPPFAARHAAPLADRPSKLRDPDRPATLPATAGAARSRDAPRS